MKKIVIIFAISLLLLSTMGYVTSKPINSSKSNDESHFYRNDIINIEQDRSIQNNGANPKPIQSRTLANSPWPMYQYDLNHTGRSPYNTSSNTGDLLWEFQTSYWIYSSPTIGPDGTIYIGSNDDNFYAINPNGTKKWNFTTSMDVRSSAAIGSDGTIYIGSDDGCLYALYPNGTKKWQFGPYGVVSSSPAIGPDGIIYVGSWDHNLYAIYPNGTKKWSYNTGFWIYSSPAIDTNGTIYIGSCDKSFYAINPNGTKKWSFATTGEVRSSAAIGSDGTIYITPEDFNLYAFNPNGTKKWNFSVGTEGITSPAIGLDGTIYYASYDGGNLYAINPNGTKKWNISNVGSNTYSSPTISSDGTIYIGGFRNVYAINPNGTKKWNFSVPIGYFDSSPAIGSDGTIYIGNHNGKVYAIGSKFQLSSGLVKPQYGYTDTYFNYTVSYLNTFNNPPNCINLSINENNYTMLETDSTDTNYLDGKDYYFNITNLDIGVHNFQFWVTEGDYTKSTEQFIGPTVYNTPPIITTSDNLTAVEDTYYEVIYQYEDIDLANVGQTGTWNYSTNATWLSFNPTTAMLYATPSNDDAGNYWVNISINDTIDMDFTNFTLTVINENDNPIIETTNVEITYEDELYEIDYNASDVDSSLIDQIWSLNTNASSWLDIDSITGTISGTPTNDDVGDYWVNVSVDDGDTGLAFTNFTLIVLNVNDRPEIITDNELIANTNILYLVDYNATDIDSLLSQLTWLLETNATWLGLDINSGVLSGTPTINDVGWYDVNITVDDGDDGQDWHDFILTVTSEGFKNEPPDITTIDKVSITAGDSYNIVYEATDDRTPVGSLIWTYNSNASWLSFNKLTRSLSGNPTLSHVGWYWVNITVNDSEGGFDSHNFTLIVWATANQPPDILTEDDINAVVDELYSVDYEAEDDRTPLDKLVWSLETNTSDWLDIDPKTGVLSGTPKLDDVGSYWIRVYVDDDEDGRDFTNFTLYVTTEPITDFKPELSNPSVIPSTGDTNTEFTFSVDYSHPNGDPPDSIEVVIDGDGHDMTLTNGHYEYKTKLSEGNHTYYFTTTLGNIVVNTDEYQTGYIDKSTDVEPDDGGDGGEDNMMLYAIVGIIVVVIVVLILLFIFLKKKKEKEEPLVEEAPPPPPEEVPPEQPPTPEVPPEQVPTPETPPLDQPPIPEVPPEQAPVPETPPEQPQVPPEQPPTPEVTPQVPQPQVEPAPPEPAPMPQVEEQPPPTPQVEPQPQVEVQEPTVEEPVESQGQAPVPTIKPKLTDQEQ